MNPVLVTPPASEPIDLATAKSHLEVVGTSKNADITSLITVARRNIERYLKRAMITQTWKVYYDCFNEEMILPFPPVQTLTHVKYYNTSGTLTTLASSNYFFDQFSEPARVIRGYDVTWPDLQEKKPNAVEIQFVCGYGDASDIPEDIIHAMKLLIEDYYDNRGEVVLGTFSQRIKGHISNLLHDYRIYRFAH